MSDPLQQFVQTELLRIYRERQPGLVATITALLDLGQTPDQITAQVARTRGPDAEITHYVGVLAAALATERGA